MGKHVKTPKKHEFSKIMAFIAITMWIVLILFAMAMMIITMDLSPLVYVFSSVNAVVGIVLGFYFWKARAENQIKLKSIYGNDILIPEYIPPIMTSDDLSVEGDGNYDTSLNL